MMTTQVKFKEIAKLIAEREGKKDQVSIAQINKILHIVLKYFGGWTHTLEDIIALLRFLYRYNPNG
jgi:hypothetical protein